MRYIYDFNGNQVPFIRKYQVGATALTTAGIPVLVSTLANLDGVLPCTNSAAADCLGVTMDTNTQVTAQQTGEAETERLVSVVVNPNAIYRANLSGGATSDTALTLDTNSALSADGLTITSALPADPYDDGYAWGYDGANMGIARKVTAVDGTTATPIVAFPRDIQVNDRFLGCSAGGGGLYGVELTGTFEQVDASGDQQTTDNLRVLAHKFLDQGEDSARTSSSLDLVIFDHLFAAGGSV